MDTMDGEPSGDGNQQTTPRHLVAASVISLLVCFLVSNRTLELRWGDGLEFTAVAAHIGIAHPPGYPLFTILGRIALLLPIEPYSAFLILCKLLTAGTLVVLWTLLRRVLFGAGLAPRAAVFISAATTVCIGLSPAMQATTRVVEVYGLNALLQTAIIALLAFRQEDASPRGIALAATLLGASLANHLPSLSLAPLLLVSALACARRSGIARPLFALLPVIVIPAILYGTMPLRVPAGDGYGIAWGAPKDASELVSVVGGGEYAQMRFFRQYGGGPSFTYETYIPFFRQRLAGLLGAVGAGFTGDNKLAIIPALLIAGLAILGWRLHLASGRERWHALALGLAIGGQTLFIFTYNIVDIADYFPALLLLLVPYALMGFASLLKEPADLKIPVAVFAPTLALSVLFNTIPYDPEAGLATTWRDRLFAHLPRGAALITNNDADVYTLWYEQHADRERLDLLCYGANFNRHPWFRQTMPPDDARRAMVQFYPGGPTGLEQYVERLRVGAIDPLLKAGPVFMTQTDQAVTAVLSRNYHIREVAPLFTVEEYERLVRAEVVNFPPPVLLEILPPTTP